VELALALSLAFADRSSGRDRCSAVPAVVEREGAIRITLVTLFLPIIRGIRSFSAGPHPKAGRGYREVEAPRGIIRLLCGAPHMGALAGRDGA
jgi:hypothetical protein